MAAPEPHVVIAARNQIGESPIWNAPEQALYWVDVEGKLIQRWPGRDNTIQRWQLEEPVGCIGLRERGGLVAASRTGFFFLDVETGKTTSIGDPEAHLPDNRFNDGKVDRRGRFWAGTRNFRDHSKTSGALYRLDPDLSMHRMEEGLVCPNGMAWSPDNRLMYLCDTWAHNIFVYEFNADEGTIRNRKLFRTLPKSEGFPDGLTVDAEGYIWNAHYDGWRIIRYAPDGKVDRVIRMPVQHVTSLTFGGKDCGTLYVTSASLRLSEVERLRQPIAGHVFALDTEVKGIPEPRFSG